MALATGGSGVLGVLGVREGARCPAGPGGAAASRGSRSPMAGEDQLLFPSPEVPAADGRPDAAGTKPGPRPLPTCLFLRRSAPHPGGRDKSAAASRVRADRARATLKEPRGGSREAGAAGFGKSLQPPQPSRDRLGARRRGLARGGDGLGPRGSALLASALSGLRETPMPPPEGSQPSPGTASPASRAAQAVLLASYVARVARVAGMRPALRPPSELACVRASERASKRPSLRWHPRPGGRWLAPGVRDTQAIVSDPRRRPTREGQAAFLTRGRERSGPDRSARS